MTKIVYEKHPVSPERKKELRAKGLKIIDARFAPKGNKNNDNDAENGQLAEKGKPLTIAELKATLEEKGIEIPKGVTKQADLQNLLDAANEQAAE